MTTKLLLATSLIIIALAAACGGGDDKISDAPITQPSPAPSLSPTGTLNLAFTVQSNPESRNYDIARTFFMRAFGFYHDREYQLAIENFDEAIRLDPEYAESYVGRGDAYLALDQYQKAIFFNRGLAYRRLGQLQRAIEDYGEAIRLDPTYMNAYVNRGFAYNQLGRYQQAMH